MEGGREGGHRLIWREGERERLTIQIFPTSHQSELSGAVVKQATSQNKQPMSREPCGNTQHALCQYYTALLTDV